MGYDTVLAPVSRNFLRIGDKVRMKDGKILTVKFVEYTDFICEEIVGYIPKKDIDTVMEYMGAKPDVSNCYMADCLIQDSCRRFKQQGCNKDCKLYM